MSLSQPGIGYGPERSADRRRHSSTKAPLCGWPAMAQPEHATVLRYRRRRVTPLRNGNGRDHEDNCRYPKVHFEARHDVLTCSLRCTASIKSHRSPGRRSRAGCATAGSCRLAISDCLLSYTRFGTRKRHQPFTYTGNFIGSSMIGLSGNKKVAAFLKKSGAKNFCSLGPVATKPARPSLTKFFCFFLFTKRSLPLRLDMTCPEPIRL
jgi:hypothetical protein